MAYKLQAGSQVLLAEFGVPSCHEDKLCGNEPATIWTGLFGLQQELFLIWEMGD